MDAVQAVTRHVIADSSGVGGDEVSALALRIAARKHSGGRRKIKDRHRSGIDQYLRGGGDLPRDLEQPERIATDERERPQREFAAYRTNGTHRPTIGLPGHDQRHNGAGVVSRHVGVVTDLQPDFRNEAGVAYRKSFVQRFADLSAAGAGLARNAHPIHRRPGPDEG